MKHLVVMAALIALAGCNGTTTSTTQDRTADAQATLAPGTAFKDALLIAAIKTKLTGDDIDSATRIGVGVHDGVVTLTGVVKDAAVKDHDGQIVSATAGVKSVTNDLRVGKVGPSTAQTVGNAALIAAVESALVAQTGINVAGVKVEARSGTVTLAGHAPSAAIKSTMLEAAKKTQGVRNVVDRITVQ